MMSEKNRIDQNMAASFMSSRNSSDGYIEFRRTDSDIRTMAGDTFATQSSAASPEESQFSFAQNSGQFGQEPTHSGFSKEHQKFSLTHASPSTGAVQRQVELLHVNATPTSTAVSPEANSNSPFPNSFKKDVRLSIENQGPKHGIVEQQYFLENLPLSLNSSPKLPAVDILTNCPLAITRNDAATERTSVSENLSASPNSSILLKRTLLSVSEDESSKRSKLDQVESVGSGQLVAASVPSSHAVPDLKLPDVSASNDADAAYLRQLQKLQSAGVRITDRQAADAADEEEKAPKKLSLIKTSSVNDDDIDWNEGRRVVFETGKFSSVYDGRAQRKKKPKKRVKFVCDEQLSLIRVFDCEPNERINVFNVKQHLVMTEGGVDIKKFEAILERGNISEALKHHGEDYTDETAAAAAVDLPVTVDWYSPPKLDFDPDFTTLGFREILSKPAGMASSEKIVEEVRQKFSMSQMYHDASKAPSSADEPDDPVVWNAAPACTVDGTYRGRSKPMLATPNPTICAPPTSAPSCHPLSLSKPSSLLPAKIATASIADMTRAFKLESLTAGIVEPLNRQPLLVQPTLTSAQQRPPFLSNFAPHPPHHFQHRPLPDNGYLPLSDNNSDVRINVRRNPDGTVVKRPLDPPMMRPDYLCVQPLPRPNLQHQPPPPPLLSNSFASRFDDSSRWRQERPPGHPPPLRMPPRGGEINNNHVLSPAAYNQNSMPFRPPGGMLPEFRARTQLPPPEYGMRATGERLFEARSNSPLPPGPPPPPPFIVAPSSAAAPIAANYGNAAAQGTFCLNDGARGFSGYEKDFAPSSQAFNKEVCRHFVNGFCRLGAKCKFAHPVSINNMEDFRRRPKRKF